MRARSDLTRTAGNVFLEPVELTQVPGRQQWRRAFVVGSGDPGQVEAAAAELRGAAPQVQIEAWGRGEGPPPGLWRVRRRGCDAAVLLLTGEGRRREKLLGVLSGAPVTLARGRTGQWYQVRLPPCRPLSLRWWARMTLAGMLSAFYLRVVVAMRITDALWRLAPLPDPVADPGPPGGTRVTFIVPTHDQRELMDLCLPPLLEEAGPVHKVLVVDDASTDGTVEHVRRRYPRVRVVRLTRNRGFARAARAGIAACDTPLFALINSDVQVRPGFLAAILPHFERDDVFAVCARIELPGGSQMETGNVAPSFSGILEPYHLPPGKPGPILFAGGASSVFHRARYDALGGFETIFQPLYWEDIDLGYRAWRAGWRSLFEPAASVWHQRRAWIGPRFGDALANETFLKNSLVFVWKNLRDRAMLTQHWVYVCARLYQEILRGEGTMCRALLRALPALLPALVRRWRARRRGDLSDRDVLAMATPEGGTARENPVR